MTQQTPQLPEDVNNGNLYRVYRLLLCLCETGVLSRACERTGLTLPTASRLLARARSWFDDQLFVHSAGRMYPTVRMKALRPKLAEAMRATDALFADETAFDPLHAQGVVRIVAIDNAFYTLLMPVIMELRKEAPGIHFRVFDRFSDMFAVMRHGDLDMAFYSMEGKSCPSDFHEQNLFESGHVLLVRRGHPLSALAKTRRLRLEEVARYEPRGRGDHDGERGAALHHRAAVDRGARPGLLRDALHRGGRFARGVYRTSSCAPRARRRFCSPRICRSTSCTLRRISSFLAAGTLLA